MIDYQVLRTLVLESLKMKPDTQSGTISSDVQQLATQHNVFPTEQECEERGINGYYQWYREKRLKPIDELNVSQIIWDLIIDRVLTVGRGSANPGWPHLRLTEFGRSVVNQESPTLYDPEGYAILLESFTPQVDPLIIQYAVEGLNCFRQRLFFAAAVMFGAAAESAILILLEAIGNAETNTKVKKEINELLERPNLPKIFSTIQSRLNSLIKAKTIPYSVHKGSTEHLLSLFEMIRVQRNDVVHPAAGQVNKTKVFLIIQTLPAAIEVIYRLVGWFSKNKI